MIVKLGDVATYINGYAFKPADWSDTGLPIIRIQDLTGNSYQANRYNGEYAPKYEVNAGDVLISWSASLGIYVWNGEKAVLNQHIFKVVFDKTEISKNFFVYQVENILEKAASAAHGATMKHLTKPVFDSLPFYLPPLDEQRKIAAVLDKVSDLISKRRQQLDQLDLLVKAKFVEMFGDVVAEIKTLSDVAKVSGGLTKNSNRASFKLKMPYLRVANVFFNKLDLDEILEIGVKENEIEKTLLKTGDLLFVEGNGSIEQIGRVAVWNGSIEPCLHQNHLIKARFKSDVVNPIYALFYFMSDKGRNQIVRKSVSTSGLNTLSVKKIESLQLPIPELYLQNQFAVFVEQTEQSKATINRSLDQLETLKKALMQEYFG